MINFYKFISCPVVHRLPFFSRHILRFAASSHVTFFCFITLSTSFSHFGSSSSPCSSRWPSHYSIRQSDTPTLKSKAKARCTNMSSCGISKLHSIHYNFLSVFILQNVFILVILKFSISLIPPENLKANILGSVYYVNLKFLLKLIAPSWNVCSYSFVALNFFCSRWQIFSVVDITLLMFYWVLFEYFRWF